MALMCWLLLLMKPMWRSLFMSVQMKYMEVVPMRWVWKSTRFFLALLTSNSENKESNFPWLLNIWLELFLTVLELVKKKQPNLLVVSRKLSMKIVLNFFFCSMLYVECVLPKAVKWVINDMWIFLRDNIKGMYYTNFTLEYSWDFSNAHSMFFGGCCRGVGVFYLLFFLLCLDYELGRQGAVFIL